jgi:hypothetical protein
MMNDSLTFLHTADSNAELFQNLLDDMAPDIAARHVVRADLLQRALDRGRFDGDIYDDAVAAFAELTLETGPGSTILCTCSTIGAAADAVNAAQEQVTILRIDRPMMQQAITLGRSIAVVATFETTLEPTLALLRRVADDNGTAVDIQPVVLKRARQAFVDGDRERYIREIAAGLAQVGSGRDVIVLAQASMAQALEAYKGPDIPILSSPVIGLRCAVDFLRNGSGSDGSS